jgi:predicted RecB family nuclease
LVREPNGVGFDELYHHIFAGSPAEEGDAFADAMLFLAADPSAHIYYYSKYERSSFRILAKRHPKVCSTEEVDRLFDPTRATDLLFDVIMPHTEWPTHDLSIKTLARSLGFEWRDADASGAASIAWFNEYAATQDADIKRRILDYNEDDVRASAVVLDGLRGLGVSAPPTWPPPLHVDGSGND